MNKNFLIDEIAMNTENIEDVTGLNFNGADFKTVINFLIDDLETIYKWNNKNLTRKQENILFNDLEILKNLEITEFEE